MPKTAALLEKICPDAVDLALRGGGEIIFSRLAPKTRISPHCATTNFRLTAHLGISIPSECLSPSNVCSIRVGTQWETWEEGRVLVFDDSFEHEVINDTDHTRIILLLRFWHPDISIHSTITKTNRYKEYQVKKNK
eukprot:GSMAST32.ASY1.ANO1.175.1 assembled CDS